MTLLNAPEFDAHKETRNRNLLIGAAVGVALIAVLAVAGFALGHGWFFINIPAEHRVHELLAAVQQQDYAKAYGIWNNDPQWQQHPQKYDYTLQRFTQDFSTDSNWKGPVTSFDVNFSKRDSTGVVVESTVNGTPLTLKVQRSDRTMDFFPYDLTRGLF